ncbi:MAG: discoidin domain-containing protein, partial [Bacteroidaceae bacterium]|nr:discoidin domain-containing protein [Bacteroidaceae bacterium]
ASHTRRAGKNRRYDTRQLTDNNPETYWATDDNTTQATLTLTWRRPQALRYLLLQEPIALGQRIGAFVVEGSTDGRSFSPLATEVETTTVGYRRIVPLCGSTVDSYSHPQTLRALRIRITDAKAAPLLNRIAVF